jgi:hypothetical protein
MINLLNTIGIIACGAPTGGTANLNVNQLPGITFKMVDSITDSDNITFVTMWNSLQDLALRMFDEDYLSGFNDKYADVACLDTCNPYDIGNTNINLFYTAWMYLLGSMLMSERLASDRLNRFTTIGNQQATELRDVYRIEYEKRLKIAIKSIPKKDLDACYECKTFVTRIESLP